MLRKRVYIAGPISKGNLNDNVNQATEAFIALARLGLAPWCPHWSVYAKPCYSYYTTKFIDGEFKYTPVHNLVECIGSVTGNDIMRHEDWMGIDLAWVAVADAVFRVPGESTGADMEVAAAVASGIPVFTDLWAIGEWAMK